jgi:hypothetical protein
MFLTTEVLKQQNDDFSRIYKATKHITFTFLVKKTFPCISYYN